MLEISPTGSAVIWSKAFLTLLTIPAAITLAVRAMHKEMQEGLKKPKKEVSVGNFPKVSENLPTSRDWRHVAHDDRMRISTMSLPEVVSTYRISERTARNWKENAVEYAQSFVYGENK
jgi:hypothetical protein